MLETVLTANASKRLIHVYRDSARYYLSKQVQAWLVDKPPALHFLPPYSPNLSPIERLWKFMRQKVINVISYPTLDGFGQGVMAFLGSLEPYRAQLERLLVLKFAIVENRSLVAV